MNKEINKEIDFATSFYNPRIGEKNWILTNEFGGTRLIIKGEQGFNWGYSQLKDDHIEAINSHNGHNQDDVSNIIASSF